MPKSDDSSHFAVLYICSVQKIPLSSQFLFTTHDVCVCARAHAHTYILIPLLKILEKLKTKNKTWQPNTMTSKLVNTKQNALKKMNKIYHMHSASTL